MSSSILSSSSLSPNSIKQRITKQDKAKQATLDEKLVPAAERVKIRLSNLLIDPTISQREEMFQVALDILKHTLFYNAFLISADVPKIYMQKILDISPRVENQAFTDPPTSEELKKFVLKLGYSGNIFTVAEIYADHMHQPWRTFGAIINKCLSGKTVANDRLCQSRLEILWRVVKKEITAKPTEPKKPKKQPSMKKKLQLEDETSESKGEPAHRQVSKKVRTPKTVVIQEPSSIPTKPVDEPSGKLKGIKLLSEAVIRSGYHQKDRKPSQNDKTEHGMEKTVQNQGQSPKMPKSESILKNQQSNRSRN
ncbi:hypothetical protein Tco_0910714 [Tanacetum coccineum]|uniref:Uncharacterized protein n=2 Tax=Tanacetum coccineum TaxID=301880 RepID=A0ABQ5CUM7_9ASTR